MRIGIEQMNMVDERTHRLPWLPVLVVMAMAL
jgi:hypothetical protein